MVIYSISIICWPVQRTMWPNKGANWFNTRWTVLINVRGRSKIRTCVVPGSYNALLTELRAALHWFWCNLSLKDNPQFHPVWWDPRVHHFRVPSGFRSRDIFGWDCASWRLLLPTMDVYHSRWDRLSYTSNLWVLYTFAIYVIT